MTFVLFPYRSKDEAFSYHDMMTEYLYPSEEGSDMQGCREGVVEGAVAPVP